MEIRLTANILKEDENAFTGWINEIKGVIAQGSTVDEVKNELFKVLRIKFDIERKVQLSKNSTPGVITEEMTLTPA